MNVRPGWEPTMGDMIELRSGDARALIAARGGELHGWRVGGRELLWSRDPAWWESSSPVLFPIVGWARNGEIRVDGKARRMGVHGFAAASDFAIEEAGPAAARLTLRDTEASQDAYPFGFRLSLTYSLADHRLSVDLEVANTGGRAMPYALGLHPAFRWPFAGATKEDYAVVFEKAETGEAPIIAPGGLFRPARRTLPIDGRRLRLSDQLFAREALCFLNARSASWTFESGDGASIAMRTVNFPHLALWSKPGAPFLCMEAWTGHGDPEGFDGELADKPSMRLLAPGAADRCGVEFHYREAGVR
jgi:galactose mutarotase-like enzyme